MFKVRKRFNRIILVLNQVWINCFFKGTRFFAIKRWLLNRAGLSIGKNVRVVAPIHIDTSCVDIGENTWIGRDFRVYGNGRVSIGANCDLAPELLIQTGSHKIGISKRRAGEGFCGEIAIGDGCWIGVRTTILPGVEISSGTVIGAGSLVNKSVESNALAVGVPCKTIRKLDN